MKLECSHNSLTEFPKIFSLERMRLIDLSTNHIQRIPDGICMNTSLVILNLFNNEISGMYVS